MYSVVLKKHALSNYKQMRTVPEPERCNSYTCRKECKDRIRWKNDCGLPHWHMKTFHHPRRCFCRCMGILITPGWWSSICNRWISLISRKDTHKIDATGLQMEFKTKSHWTSNESPISIESNTVGSILYGWSNLHLHTANFASSHFGFSESAGVIPIRM